MEVDMAKKSNLNNEEKLKELTYQHAKMFGQKWQELATSPIDKNEIDQMDETVQKGIELNLLVNKMRQVIQKIDTDELKDLPIPENSEYKYAYYLYLLASLTHNVKLIKYAENLKKEVLKRENEK